MDSGKSQNSIFLIFSHLHFNLVLRFPIFFIYIFHYQLPLSLLYFMLFIKPFRVIKGLETKYAIVSYGFLDLILLLESHFIFIFGDCSNFLNFISYLYFLLFNLPLNSISFFFLFIFILVVLRFRGYGKHFFFL